MMGNDNIVKSKSYAFALGAISLYKYLKDQKLFEISSQFIRSATSIGANVEEALAAQSKKDFVAKMSIASKEARESNYWLRLIKDAKMAQPEAVESLLSDSEELIRILTSIVKTSSLKLRTNNSKLKIKN